jgi:hypothetical protein
MHQAAVSCAFLLNDWKGLSAIPILCGYFITNCAEAHPLSGQAGFATSAFGWHKRAVRILYHLPLSPYARKVRLALAEKRIPFDLRVERVWERRQEFLEINPAGTVPVLQEENGFCVIDSYAICEYLDEAYPDMPLLGRAKPAIRKADEAADGPRQSGCRGHPRRLCQFAPASGLPRLACGNPALAWRK